ncbi:MAG: transposase, partial [Candidatus Helarchaeota archaeon]
DKFIPIRSRKKKYRQCCITLKEHQSFKKIFKERISVERYFGIIKRTMDLENHRMAGLRNIYKHVLIQCIAYLVKILVSAKLGILESIRSVRFFQN